jgi:phosphoribosylformimino-5-aminoimidazole carboxamide ribonucleotide (ProFAR) isomerase
MAAAPARRWTRFRGCIDLHGGRVKQIVGGTLTDSGAGLRTNHVAAYAPRRACMGFGTR